MQIEKIIAMNESAARREAYGVKEIPFGLAADFVPTGDQPQAIEKLVEGIQNREKFQTLVGVTGSGKTYTIAKQVSVVVAVDGFLPFHHF